MNAKLADFILARPFGFVAEHELSRLIAIDPLCLLLVRCQQCRFLAPANQSQHIITALEFAGDYVRDISFPADLRKQAAEVNGDFVAVQRRD